MRPFIVLASIIATVALVALFVPPNRDVHGQEMLGGLPRDTYDQALGELTRDIFVTRASQLRPAGLTKEDRFRHYRLLADESKIAAQAFLYQYRLTLNNPPFEPEKP